MIQVQPIAHARVPIVKFVDPQTRINCDVNANHVLGIHNSELIRCYTLIDDRVRPFIYNLKAIVKKHKINDSSQAWLSSYAYVMMAIGFLQAQVCHPAPHSTKMHRNVFYVLAMLMEPSHVFFLGPTRFASIAGTASGAYDIPAGPDGS